MSDDDTYEVPLQDQRVFGAGIKRKRVHFVPSSTTTTVAPVSTAAARPISDLYLNLVLPKESPNPTKDINISSSSSPTTTATSEIIPSTASEPDAPASEDAQLCEICKLPLSSAPAPPTSTIQAASSSTALSRPPPKPRPHEASLAHQVCLTHSHQPSSLDRSRKGLTFLSSYGWDPDSRLGLGASGQGIRYPIKMKEKDDKLGIGIVVPKDATASERKQLQMERRAKLDAGEMRKLAERDRRKGERLRQMFYANEDVNRYLGTG